MCRSYRTAAPCPRWDVAGAVRVRGVPAHGARACAALFAGLRGQFRTESVPPRGEKVGILYTAV